MNDFTKEELVLLACWSANRYLHVGDKQSENEGTFILSHKIQDMIANYCEHKNNTNHESNCTICDDCHKVIG